MDTSTQRWCKKPVVPKLLRHLTGSQGAEACTATLLESSEGYALMDPSNDTAEIDADVARLESMRDNLVAMGCGALAEKTEEEIARMQKKKQESQRVKPALSPKKAKDLLDAAHRHHLASKRAVESQQERVRAVQAHLLEEEKALEEAKAEEEQAAGILKVAMSNYHHLMQGDEASAASTPADPAPMARTVDRVQLCTAMEKNLRTSMVAPEEVQATYQAAREKAESMGGMLTEAQHMWNTMVANMMKTMGEVLFQVVAPDPTLLEAEGHNQGGGVTPVTPKQHAEGVIPSSIVPPSQASTIAGAARELRARPSRESERGERSTTREERERSRSLAASLAASNA